MCKAQHCETKTKTSQPIKALTHKNFIIFVKMYLSEVAPQHQLHPIHCSYKVTPVLLHRQECFLLWSLGALCNCLGQKNVTEVIQGDFWSYIRKGNAALLGSPSLDTCLWTPELQMKKSDYPECTRLERSQGTELSWKPQLSRPPALRRSPILVSEGTSRGLQSHQPSHSNINTHPKSQPQSHS